MSAQELNHTKHQASDSLEQHRKAIQALREAVVKVEASFGQRTRSGYGELQLLFGFIGRMRDLLFPAGAPPNPNIPLSLNPQVVASLSRVIGDSYRSLSQMSSLFSNVRDPVITAAVQAAIAVAGELPGKLL